MRDARGVGGFEDLTLLLVAVCAFALFFASLARAYAAQEAQERGARLEALADSLLAAMLNEARWTRGPALIDPAALIQITADDLRPFAAGHPLEVSVWNVITEWRWTLRSENSDGDQRTASTAANLIGTQLDPARVTATVWGP